MTAGGFNANRGAAEDWMLWLTISRIGQVAKIADFTYFYRQHASSASHQSPMALAGLSGLLDYELQSAIRQGWKNRSAPDFVDHVDLIRQTAAWSAGCHDRRAKEFALSTALLMCPTRRHRLQVRLIFKAATVARRLPLVRRLATAVRPVDRLLAYALGRERTTQGQEHG
jgi:hypothetical protein